MDLSLSPKGKQHLGNLRELMLGSVMPAEAELEREPRPDSRPGTEPAVLEPLKRAARERGLWNLYLSGPGQLSQVDYAHLAEMTGWSPDLAPAAINGSAPDSVNMVMLEASASQEQRETWLRPLAEDECRSAFAMTEPGVASSDANNIATTIERQGDEYVIRGGKWYISGAVNPRCQWLFVMGVSDPQEPKHRRHSIVTVPIDAPGVTVVRPLSVYGYVGDQAEIDFNDVSVPIGNLLGDQGRGFQIAQTRLAAARLHHCFRMIGLAERGLRLAVMRGAERTVGGSQLSELGVFRNQIAECRLLIDQARLLNLKAAWQVDKVGGRAAQVEISAGKVAATRMAVTVLDRCVAMHGALGLSEDTPLARWWAGGRALHIADGPEEVHLEVVARAEVDEARTYAGLPA